MPDRESSKSRPQSLIPRFEKQWGWLIGISITWGLGALFVLYQMVTSMPAANDFSQLDVLTHVIGMGGIGTIAVALACEFYGHFSVEISEKGVEKTVLGKKRFLNWAEVDTIRWERGITLVGKDRSITFSPNVFIERTAVYEFIEVQWERARKEETRGPSMAVRSQ